MPIYLLLTIVLLDNYHIYEHNLLTVVYNYDLTYDLLFVCVAFALGLF